MAEVSAVPICTVTAEELQVVTQQDGLARHHRNLLKMLETAQAAYWAGLRAKYGFGKLIQFNFETGEVFLHVEER